QKKIKVRIFIIVNKSSKKKKKKTYSLHPFAPIFMGYALVDEEGVGAIIKYKKMRDPEMVVGCLLRS
ncbi:hypothetical protein CFP56_022553, partial [Quercus suber]